MTKDDSRSPEALIAEEIDGLRARFPDTRELYREVCALLFFRFGITPTANRLYQYVRKGSMATPAQVLAKFWSDLRERTRLRIDHPDLPPALRDSAGELVLQLWGQARQQAAANFEDLSAQAAEQVAAERALARSAEQRSRDLATRLETMTAELARSKNESAALGRELATIQGRLASMTEMLRDQADEMRVLREELASSGRDVARAVGETNALRVQLALARRRGSRKPLGGVPQDPDQGQDDLGLDQPPAGNAPGAEKPDGDESE